MTPQNDGAIAIVGMGCRYPGARGPRELWETLLAGRCTVTEVPQDRPALAELPRTGSPGRFGGFIDGVEEFDAEFFGISPREAGKMDPQKRILLETVWEALEDAGIPPSRLAGSDTGVFVGEQATDYWDLVRSPDCDLHTLVGSQQRSALSGRISYWFDLRGPSYSVEAACASSLVAVFEAVSALRAGRSRVCLAAGTNLILTPDQSTAYAGAGALAADGRCKFGDAGADGFVRSDGVGVLVLKRLSDAVADGDDVYAVILGGAVGHDGRSSGNPMQPAVEGQAAVLRAALADAGVDAPDIGYVEAHGTGTPAGDLAELNALARVLGTPGRTKPCLVGSIKTNIGHTEAAAGVAGVMKAALSLRHNVIPPSLHMRTPNPAVQWGSIAIAAEATSWPDDGQRRHVGVSSFGISGVNAHLVLAAAPRVYSTPVSAEPSAVVLPLSARTPEALVALAERYVGHLRGTDRSAAEICASAALRRDHLRHRLAVAGANAEELADGLCSALNAGLPPAQIGRRLVFVYSGHGSQWAGMARELIERSAVFRDAMVECDRAVAEETGWSVLDVLRGDREDDYLAVDRVHPVLFSVQVALTALWRAWGVVPDIVLGHSMGEVSAAHAAGALTLADAVRVICRRSRLLARLRGTGLMAWVELSRAEAEREIADVADRISVAIVNSERSTVLAGEPDAMTQLLTRLEDRAVFCRPIAIDLAAHSPALDGLMDEMAAELTGIRPVAGARPFHSTVVDRVVDSTDLDPAYWSRNLRDPVLFGPAIRSVLADGPCTVVEISPHPVILTAITEALGPDDLAFAAQRRGQDQLTTMLDGLARLHTAGHQIDWPSVVGDHPPTRLPNYAWQGDRFPLPSGAKTTAEPSITTTEANSAKHPVLASLTRARRGKGWEWEGLMDLAANAYLLDHRVNGRPLLPTTAHLELVAAAVRSISTAGGGVVLRDVSILRPVHLDGPETRLRLRVESRGGEWWFEISTSDPAGSGEWVLVAEGEAATTGTPVPEIPAACDLRPVAPPDFYAEMRGQGNEWAGAFRALTRLSRGDGRAHGTVRRPSGIADGHAFHPALLDACVQVACAALPQDGRTVVGAAIEFVAFHDRPADELDIVASAEVLDGKAVLADVWISDPAGTVVAQLRGIRMSYLSAPAEEPNALRDEVYQVEWDGRPEQPAMSSVSYWVLADEQGVGEQLADRLAGSGDRVVVVSKGTNTRRVAPERYEVDPLDAAGIARMLVETANGRPGRVVHCWSLDIDSMSRAEDVCLSVSALVRAVAKAGLDLGLVLVTSGSQTDDGIVHPEQGVLWGLGRVLANERPRLDVRLVDVDPAAPANGLLAEVRAAAHEGQIALRAGRRLAPRLRRHPWDARSPRMLAASDVAVSGRYVGLGTDGRPVELSGVVTGVGEGITHCAIGDEVVALLLGAGTTDVTVPDNLVHRKPHGLSMVESAAVGADYVTAYLALHDFGDITSGDRVLVVGAATGAGLAAVSLAKRAGGRLFAVCDTDDECALLRHLGAEWAATDTVVPDRSSGFDIVLDLRGDYDATELLAPSGRAVVVGHARPLDGGCSRTAFTLTDFAQRNPTRVRDVLHTVITLIEDGTLPPLPHSAGAAGTSPFRKTVQPLPSALGPVRIRENATYVITGGLGDLGMEVAEWLVDRGARHLLLLGRSARIDADGPKSPALRRMRSKAQVECAAVDVADPVALRAALERHMGPPVVGVVHAAGVLDAAEVADLTPEHVRRVFRGKAAGAAAIDQVFAGASMDFVVLFSAGSALLGFPFVGAYAAANAYVDAVARCRRAQGLPWLSVNWGYWAGIGMAVRRERELGQDLVPAGMSRFTPADATAVLGDLVSSGIPQAAVLPTDWQAWAQSNPTAAGSPLFAELLGTASAPEHRTVPSADGSSEAIPYLREQVGLVLGLPADRVRVEVPLNEQGLDSLLAMELRTHIEREAGVLLPVARIFRRTLLELAADLAREPHGEPGPVAPKSAMSEQVLPTPEVVARVRAQVALILGTSDSRVAVDLPLNEQGLDSLLAMELRTTIEKQHGVMVPVARLFRRSVVEIATVVAESARQHAEV